MRKIKYIIWKKQEYHYKAGYGFIPNLVSYQHDEDENIRAAMVIVPGGGYQAVASTEAEIVALEFYEKGYNTFVLTYTTNILQDCPLKKQPLWDLSRAVRCLRKNALQLKIDAKQIILCGFSAGGHLVGSLCVHAADIIDSSEYQELPNCPDGVILSYPVVTTDKWSHGESFKTLLGQEISAEEKTYWSIEKQVSSTFPPAFIWHTITDQIVPVANSLLLSQSLREQHVIHALHLFSAGGHGLSLANERWASGDVGDTYTKDQLLCTIEYFKRENRTEEAKQLYQSIVPLEERKRRCQLEGILPNEEVAVWPELADQFLKRYVLNY